MSRSRGRHAGRGRGCCLTARDCNLPQVGPKDSLNSIALNFNVTPNKLVQLNKLFCHSVYPGQVSEPPRGGDGAG